MKKETKKKAAKKSSMKLAVKTDGPSKEAKLALAGADARIEIVNKKGATKGLIIGPVDKLTQALVTAMKNNPHFKMMVTMALMQCQLDQK